MDRETLIKKWLNHSLTEAEMEDFKSLPDYDELVSLNEGLMSLKAPNFNKDLVWNEIRERTQKNKVRLLWYKTAISIAASVLIGFGLLFFTNIFDLALSTSSGESLSVTLPDESAVLLNANTSIHYARVNWSSDRSVHLIGEAYFKVTKGNHFTVRTDLGNVTVLGTEFNVVNRRGIFEVMCYEGSVSVSSDHNEIILTPGEGYRLINGSPLQLKTITTAPTWIENESSFNQWPLHFVLDELERQYDIRIDDSQIDSQQSFTGSFTHTNLELALKTVLTPFDLTYTKEQNQIVLVRE